MKRRILFYTTLWLSSFCGIQQGVAQLTFASVRKSQEGIRAQEKITSLITLLKKLELTHKTSFIYQKELLENKTFSGELNENEKLERVLERVLTPANLRFQKLKGGGYTILPRRSAKDLSLETGLLKTSDSQSVEQEADRALATNALASKADLQTLSIAKTADVLVKGKVTDTEKGEPIPGVSVVLKGSTRGTNTDANGIYSIAVPTQGAVLVFSFVGYDKQEVTVGNGNGSGGQPQTQINIALKPDMKELNEVVVVGFGTQKKATVTGAIASVTTKDLVQSPVANISNSLVGRMPGLFAVQGSGEPGNNQSTLRIRGVSTFSGAADPLILVNGVEVSNYNNIDPNEIENLTILKDASATAIYGIRGANGVLLITTKRGKIGRPQLSYTGNVASTSFTALRKGMNSYDYARSYNEAQRYDAYVSGSVYAPKFSDNDLALYKSGEDPIFHPNTDWYDLTLKPQALQTQHNLTINGGTEKVRYFVSTGFFSQGGQFNNTQLVKDFDANRKYKRYNFRSSFDFDVTKRLKASLDLSSQTENLTGSNNLNGTANNSARIIESIARANPLTSPGFIGDKIVDLTGLGTVTNPLSTLFAEGYNRQFKNFLQGSLRLDYTLDFITEGLTATGIVNYQNNNTETLVNRRTLVTYNAIRLPDGAVNLVPNNVEQPFGFTQTIGKNRRTYAQFGFDYKRAFGDHAVTGLVNYNQTKYFDPALAFLIPNGYQGVVGRTTYGYKGRYLAEFTFGYNGTENFAPGNRFGFFPAYSLGWVASDEPFFPKSDVVTYLKVRGSYGEVGNDKVGSDRFLYRDSVYTLITNTNTGGYFFGEVGSTSTRYNYAQEARLGNVDVTWERAIKQNLGVELAFWKGKIGVTADFFSEQRNNILANRGTVPIIVGSILPAYNLGRMRNRGFDGDITYNDRVGNLNFFVKGNFTFARNKVEFQDEIPRPFSYQYRTGQRFGQYFGLVAEGLYNTWEEVNDANRPVSSWNNNRIQPGDIKYKDVNGDGVINNDDQVPIGYSNFPEKIFGVSFGGNYKGFDLSVLFQGADNVSIAYSRRQIRGFFENSGAVDYLLNSWSPERLEKGLPIDFPHLSIGDDVQKHNYQASSFWTRDASYVRLKNVEIGYNFPVTLLSRIGLSASRIYVNANNLYTWSSVFPGVDPEQPPGITNEEPYPLTRVINVGLNLRF
ncbi:SusC/RagA family TonB-linked outer membrane protein [Spirosoma soli]|uniref:SusC/RagA family TonB-linked outer membrane protein n=1 Tax=Spirosoma soli TaxID=1770529 RepID=A0ABW5M2F1_9BACT